MGGTLDSSASNAAANGGGGLACAAWSWWLQKEGCRGMPANRQELLSESLRKSKSAVVSVSKIIS
jgi:hypothetical protein